MQIVRKFLPLSLVFIAACSTQSQVPNPNLVRPNLQAQNANRAIPKPPTTVIHSPNQNERPADAKITAIVMHHTATKGSANAVGKFFQDPTAKVSSHYVVDRTGYLVEPVAEEGRAWHAGNSSFQGQGNVNNFSIGIEICNVGDSLEPYPDAQYDSLIKLTAYLMEKYNIPVSGLTRHRDIGLPAGRKIDTSNNFSMERVIAGVTALRAGNYQAPPARPPVAVNLPDFIEVKAANGQSFEDLADIYLDVPARAKEIAALNPSIASRGLRTGDTVRIPLNYSYYGISDN